MKTDEGRLSLEEVNRCADRLVKRLGLEFKAARKLVNLAERVFDTGEAATGAGIGVQNASDRAQAEFDKHAKKLGLEWDILGLAPSIKKDGDFIDIL